MVESERDRHGYGLYLNVMPLENHNCRGEELKGMSRADGERE
eukprot:CAMPEP_0176455160 /NCGR_PEP_ID=MMETSP0127-20121128/30439_1 /TAXON_ID=938130 /ORGANISM="Platyophrya macrostoma, Strain WH" /LENGTH=41 /DNA_ID= /DNA_START= /DNA_END= /DNA_ORIENTATION=